MFRCLACRSWVEADDVAIRLTDNPADVRVLCTYCDHLDDRDRHGVSDQARAEVTATVDAASSGRRTPGPQQGEPDYWG